MVFSCLKSCDEAEKVISAEKENKLHVEHPQDVTVKDLKENALSMLRDFKNSDEYQKYQSWKAAELVNVKQTIDTQLTEAQHALEVAGL